MRKIDFSSTALKSLSSLPEKHLGQIIRKIDSLAENITSIPHIAVINHAPLRRIKSGEYRIIFK